jgi:predicted nucleic acid-binding protein
VIVADTGAVLALIDADDAHHDVVRSVYERAPERWILPWAVLPEVDYLLRSHVAPAAGLAFVRDIAEARFVVDWGAPADLIRVDDLCTRYHTLDLGLVDVVVMAMAERLNARAIAALDLRHFGAVRLRGSPVLLPRDA